MNKFLKHFFSTRAKIEYDGAHYDFDELASAASGSWFSRIVGGIIAPLVAIYFGIICVVTEKAFLPSNRGSDLDLRGLEAILIGVALISVGLFAHFHYCWTTNEKLSPFAYWLKVLTLTAAVIAFITVVLRVFSALFR